MRPGCWPMLAGALLIAGPAWAADGWSPEQLAFFENRVRPVLIEHCYECHSEQAKKLKGGLRLDHRDGLVNGGESGPAIVPGKPDESLLIEAVRYQSFEMPPSGKLPEAIIADLAHWIRIGAPDPRDPPAEQAAQPPSIAESTDGRDHWAFQPVKTPARPNVVDPTWPLSDVDFFILSRLDEAGLKPAAEADRYAWLRRVSFDLGGLPPTPEEMEDFVQDTSPAAYETVVDRLLGSRAFGERWARHWLDLVGYADQVGTSNELFAEHAWRYRDWVIEAFERDKPFDRFIREQIAGDLLPYESVSERAANLTATGFLVLGDMSIVEADKPKLRVDVIDQQLDKVGKAFLGMTLGCARCHDHKFDPIPQHDYYALAGFFYNTESFVPSIRPVWSDVIAVELPETEAQQVERAERARLHAERIAALERERDEAARRKTELEGVAVAAREREGSPQDEREKLSERIKQLDEEIVHAKFFAPSVAKVYSVRESAQPSDMRITIRGNPLALGDLAPRGFLSVITTERPAIAAGTSGRAELA